MAEVYLITSDPQTLASCSGREDVQRRLPAFRSVHGVRVRRLAQNGWEDVTHQFDHILRVQSPPNLDDLC